MGGICTKGSTVEAATTVPAAKTAKSSQGVGGGKSKKDKAMGWLRDYEVDTLLGSGAFGSVYKVRRRRDNGVFALKIVNCPNSQSANEALKEVRSWHNLRHPGIVTCFDFFLEDFNVCILMEYIDGGDLKGEFDRLDPRVVAERRVVSWLYQMVSALAYLHAQNIVHRDIKSSNSWGGG